MRPGKERKKGWAGRTEPRELWKVIPKLGMIRGDCAETGKGKNSSFWVGWNGKQNRSVYLQGFH
jgi:hypothetical protein